MGNHYVLIAHASSVTFAILWALLQGWVNSFLLLEEIFSSATVAMISPRLTACSRPSVSQFFCDLF